MTGTNPLLEEKEHHRQSKRGEVAQRLFTTIAEEYGFEVGGFVRINEQVAGYLMDGAQAAAAVAARLAVAVGMDRFEFIAACGEEFKGEAEADVMRETGKKATRC